jgi:hypothetical protein
MNLSKIPEKYRPDIEKTFFCLKEEGCTTVFLFASLLNNIIKNKFDLF